jgi:hypothetical protein
MANPAPLIEYIRQRGLPYTESESGHGNALRPLLGYSTYGSYRLLFPDCIKIKERFLLLTKSLIALRPLA